MKNAPTKSARTKDQMCLKYTDFTLQKKYVPSIRHPSFHKSIEIEMSDHKTRFMSRVWLFQYRTHLLPIYTLVKLLLFLWHL